MLWAVEKVYSALASCNARTTNRGIENVLCSPMSRISCPKFIAERVFY